MLKARKAAATVDNIEAQAILILSGAYIGFLPVHYAERWVARGDMYRIGPDQFGTEWPFCAIIRRVATPPTILRVFMIDLMESYRMVRQTARSSAELRNCEPPELQPERISRKGH
jgi:DNA-binding transcriptional LysR family regulator